ncbi:hypothetical protein LXL04_023994 [Taraxacum kok-saghyz]
MTRSISTIGTYSLLKSTLNSSQVKSSTSSLVQLLGCPCLEFPLPACTSASFASITSRNSAFIWANSPGNNSYTANLTSAEIISLSSGVLEVPDPLGPFLLSLTVIPDSHVISPDPNDFPVLSIIPFRDLPKKNVSSIPTAHNYPTTQNICILALGSLICFKFLVQAQVELSPSSSNHLSTKNQTTLPRTPFLSFML